MPLAPAPAVLVVKFGFLYAKLKLLNLKEKKVLMSNEIIFTDTGNIPEAYYPKPASGSVPDWYKNMVSYLGNGKIPTGTKNTNATIKRCMPVFDAMTAGYILYTFTDIYVSQKDGYPYFNWNSYVPIQFHGIEQAPTHPSRGSLKDFGLYPKFMNPWAIKTPKGYSTLFTQPMHRESVFTILDGVVDTDNYTSQVNFPFVLNDWNFEGMIPAGTPMVQVIPFKRESWQMQIGNEKNLQEVNKINTYLLTSFFDSYKNKFRKPKEYK